MFGGLAPLPLRLGGGAVDGLTAAQFLRLADHVAACVRSCPFAILTYTKAADMVTVHACNGMTGMGAGAAPAATAGTLGVVTWTFPSSCEDAYEIAEPVAIRHAKATVHGASALDAEIVSIVGNVVRVRTFDPATQAGTDATVTLVVW